MKNIIPKDSRYVPLVQQPYCCVPACISMIMLKHKIPLVSQELLGYYLGLVIPKKDKKFFWNPRTGKKPLSGGYGTQIRKKRYHPNTVFPKLKIPLKMKYYSREEFNNIKEYTCFIKKVVRENRDVLVCYNYRALYGIGNNGGHVSLIEKVIPGDKEVRLVDPTRWRAKWRIVEIKKLVKAIEVHQLENCPGFWEFIKIK